MEMGLGGGLALRPARTVVSPAAAATASAVVEAAAAVGGAGIGGAIGIDDDVRQGVGKEGIEVGLGGHSATRGKRPG